jgi:F-type H+-transporting ATPase subunit delta
MSVAGTYAEALYEAAADQGAVDAVSDDLGAVRAALAETPALRQVLESPEVDTSRKKAVVTELLGGLNPLVNGFVQVLLDRGRVEELDDIAAAYKERVDRAEGRVTVEAVTAVPLTPELRQRIREKVKAQTGRDAELTEVVDPSVIGGLLLRVGDVVVDGSLRSRLTELRRTLGTAPVPVEAAPAGPAGD